MQLLTHLTYAKDEIVFLGIMTLSETHNALEQVNAYLDALTAAIEEVGGELIYVYDILSEGTGRLCELHGESYRGWVAYSVRFPSRAALVETMLSQPVIEARTQRNTAVDGVQMMLGTDNLPAVAALEVDIDAVNFDDDGNGIYRVENGQDWIYPAEGFGGHGVV
jgi:hypothetical protein